MKSVLVQEAGGQCVLCGYDRHVRALEFHHIEPSEKRLAISGRGVTHALHKLRVEAQKCVLLCANCHAEVEDGAATVPLQSLAIRVPINHKTADQYTMIRGSSIGRANGC